MFAAYALSFWYGMVLVKDGEMTFQEVVKVFMSILMAAFGLGQVRKHPSFSDTYMLNTL
jgi:hypothetical protein